MRLALHLAALAFIALAPVSHAVSTGSAAACSTVGPAPPTECDGRDRTWFPVSVVGSQTFCTLGPDICGGDKFAACPGPNDLLPYGSKCVQIATKVYGCVPKTTCDNGVQGASARQSQTPSTPSPQPSTPSPDVTTSISPTSATSSTASTVSTASTCENGCAVDPSIPRSCKSSEGWSAVSVVDVGTFCAKGPTCSGNTRAACPEPQPGLPFGSFCTRIPSGVFGCVKNTACQRACNAATPSPGLDNSDRTSPTSNGDTPSPASTITQTPTNTDTPPPAPAPSTSPPPDTPTADPASVASPDDNSSIPSPDEGDDNVSLLPVPPIEDLVFLEM